MACREATSTNAVALALAAQGAPEGSVVVADYQAAGRGRQGRAWMAPPGTGLLVSVLLRPACQPQRIPPISLVSAVACREALALSGVEAHLKWPNDVFLHGKKLGGILLEAISAGVGRPAVVVGIGLNLHQRREEFPPALRERATSVVVATGRHLDRADVLALLLSSLDRWYRTYLEDGFAPVREAWLDGALGLGQWVRLDGQGKGGIMAGRVLDLDRNGSLILEAPGGRRLTVYAGEIS